MGMSACTCTVQQNHRLVFMKDWSYPRRYLYLWNFNGELLLFNWQNILGVNCTKHRPRV